MNIGNWVKRRGQKWHLVESVVAGDAVTKCGRRMDRGRNDYGGQIRDGELQVSDVMPWTPDGPPLCKRCDPGEFKPTFSGVTWVEDDPAVGQVDPE